ncbi:MAG TPA: DUF1232 domain-containing protein [Halanaerobiales bacterium]|nr:DUF1232 domain-containing protein [Halanaerobiales bacterium]
MRLLQKVIRIIRFFRDKNVPFHKKFLLALPLIYLVIPYDFIGDFLPFLGQLDDIAVFVIMWPFLSSMMNEYQKTDNDSKENIDKSDSIDLNKNDYEIN